MVEVDYVCCMSIPSAQGQADAWTGKQCFALDDFVEDQPVVKFSLFRLRSDVIYCVDEVSTLMSLDTLISSLYYTLNQCSGIWTQIDDRDLCSVKMALR